jgi:transposase
VIVGIETDRGAWVQALIAAGYQVYAINPRQVARFKERYGTSGAKSDKGDAHALADMVRIDRDQLRPIAGDSDQAQGRQGRCPRAPDSDLGAHPDLPAAAQRVARVLPRRTHGLRRAGAHQ